MAKYVSLDKRSKKAKKEYYSSMRMTWGELNPVTRTVPSKKTYNRNKDKQERRRADREFRNGFDIGSFLLGDGGGCAGMRWENIVLCSKGYIIAS
ncbi:MAG: hypothetical protein KBS96_06325 [Lachnospiraceae bacterium]|nr:hypothetical protein [Candidatus Colinaster scatohippi]